jgi:thymidylate kinase
MKGNQLRFSGYLGGLNPAGPGVPAQAQCGATCSRLAGGRRGAKGCASRWSCALARGGGGATVAEEQAGRDELGALIAIVGSDGSGKSTVGEALLAWLRQSGPAELCHLGKQSGNLGRAVGRMPLLGQRMERTIEDKVKQAEGPRGPGLIEALTIYAFSLRRLRRFQRMLRHRRSGVTILADRFPQLAVPAGLDGPGFGRVKTDRGIAKRLAALEWRQFEWMTSHRPDLVIRLNVDVATAIARKPDHSRERLAAKIADISRLSFAGAPIVDIDATRPIEEVVAEAKAAVAGTLGLADRD